MEKSAYDKAAEFFRSVLSQKSKSNLFPIVRLTGHRSYASRDVKNVIKNDKDLITLFLTYPEIFEVVGGKVRLIENISKNNEHSLQDRKKSILPSKLTPEDMCLNSSSSCVGRQNPLTKTAKMAKFNHTNSFNYNSLSSHANSSGKSLSQKLPHFNTLKVGSQLASKERETTLTKAATYFLNAMWNLKPLNAFPIIELYKLKYCASLDIQNICGTNPKEFKDFLSSCSNFFIVTGENVLPKMNIPRKDWAPPNRGIETELSCVMHNFFKTYTAHGPPLRLENLFDNVGKCFVNSNGKKFFESSNDLAVFLEMFPETFYICDGRVINILNFEQSNEDALNISQPLVTETEHWKEEILSRTELIKDLETCKLRARDILDNEGVISLDCEGVNLGVDGVVCLLQIGTESGLVYIFDVKTVPEMLTEGYLNDICESKKKLKVIHDCRNDSANLFLQFGIALTNIFDTRIANRVITGTKKIKNIGFNDLCQLYGAPINVKKDEFKGIFKIKPGFWLKRPLTDEMVAYAALDVACLVPHVYNNMKNKLGDSEFNQVLSLSGQASKDFLQNF